MSSYIQAYALKPKIFTDRREGHEDGPYLYARKPIPHPKGAIIRARCDDVGKVGRYMECDRVNVAIVILESEVKM